MKRFVRQPGSKRLKSTVFVAAEGAVTEKEYLEILRNLGCDHLYFVPSSAGKSAPRQVLSRMKNKLKALSVRPDDEAWLLVDRDDWNPKDIQALFDWRNKDTLHRHVVVSNPCVEFWLLLHFENAGDATTAEICKNRLKKHWPSYDKHIPAGSLSEELIQAAVSRAKDLCDEKSWTEPGSTTFHHLVHSLLDSRP